MREPMLQLSQLCSHQLQTKFPGRELISRVSKFCLDEWHDIRNCCENNILHSIYHTAGSVTHSKSIRRRDCIVALVILA